MIRDVARCLLVAKDESALVDVDLVTGREVRRVAPLPMMNDAWFAADGSGLGIHRTAAVGKGPTVLRFLQPDGRVGAEWLVPNATSQIARGPDRWYVGCRNGLLYAFTGEGALQWTWDMPGARDYAGNVYFRPCPYHVAAGPTAVVVASLGQLYAIAPTGHASWQTSLPNARPLRRALTVARTAAGLTLSLEGGGLGTLVSRVSVTDEEVAVGSSDGRLYRYTAQGRFTDVRVMGTGPVRLATRADGTVGAAWCEGRLWFAADDTIIADDEDDDGALKWPLGLLMRGEAVLLWRDRTLHVIEAARGAIWSATLAHTITRVATHGDILVCAAGRLTAFRPGTDNHQQHTSQIAASHLGSASRRADTDSRGRR